MKLQNEDKNVKLQKCILKKAIMYTRTININLES